MEKAIIIIKGEHRSLAAVVNGLLFVVNEVEEHGTKPDFALLSAMLSYIENFPERLHHPKEDRYLFRLLRQRDPSAAPLLDDLEHEHASGAEAITRLRQALEAAEHGGPAAFAVFAALARKFAEFHWAHMRREEHDVIPKAEKMLLPEDWAEINGAFAANDDPLFGAEANEEMQKLFTRIVTLAPPPIGVGPAR